MTQENKFFKNSNNTEVRTKGKKGDNFDDW